MGLLNQKNTVAEAIAPLVKARNNLIEVKEVREQRAVAKGEQIQRLQNERDVDISEAADAITLLEKIEGFLP